MAITPLDTAEQIEIVEKPVTGDLRKRTSRQQILDEKPIVTGPKEPIFIIDWSGSNHRSIAKGVVTTRIQFLQSLLPLAAGILGKDDTAGLAQSDPRKVGVRSFAFNEPQKFGPWDEDEEEFDDRRDLGDLNEANAPEALDESNFEGRTFITPALKAAEFAYEKEFGHLPLDKQPTAMIGIFSDGELNDPRDFEAWLSVRPEDRKAMRKRVVGVAVYGDGDLHDAAVASYRRISEDRRKQGWNDMGVVALTGVSSPQEAVLDIQLMAA